MGRMSYLIYISDKHIAEDETEESELLITGTLQFYGADYAIRYKETGEGLENCFVTLLVEQGKKVTMRRSGALSAEMIMETGKRHNCIYNTPAGAISMGVYTEEVASDMTPDGGTLRFVYTIDVNNSLLNTNILTVKLQRKDEQP